MIFLANTYLINYPLPLWYPLIALGLFIIVCIFHYLEYEITNDQRTDNLICGAAYLLLFASQFLYITMPHKGETMFYYMAPDVVGWTVAIIAFILTAAILCLQFILYMKFTENLHAHPFTYTTNFAAVVAVLAITWLKIVGLFEDFIDEHLYIFIIAVVSILTLSAIIQNIIEKSYWQILIEVPLLLLGLFISIFATIIPIVCIVLFCIVGMFSKARPESMDTIDTRSRPNALPCRYCVHYKSYKCSLSDCDRDSNDRGCGHFSWWG